MHYLSPCVNSSYHGPILARKSTQCFHCSFPASTAKGHKRSNLPYWTRIGSVSFCDPTLRSYSAKWSSPTPKRGQTSSQSHLPRCQSMSFSGKCRPFAHAALQWRCLAPQGVLRMLLARLRRRRWLHVREAYCASNLKLLLSWSSHCSADASAITSDLRIWRLHRDFFQQQSLCFNPHGNERYIVFSWTQYSMFLFTTLLLDVVFY